MTQKMTTKKTGHGRCSHRSGHSGKHDQLPGSGSRARAGAAHGQYPGRRYVRPWLGRRDCLLRSLLRNILGIGSLMAFPGSMIGAFCCGHGLCQMEEACSHAAWPRRSDRYPGRDCRVSGGGIPDGAGPAGLVCLCSSLPDLHGSRKHPGLRTDHSTVQGGVLNQLKTA